MKVGDKIYPIKKIEASKFNDTYQISQMKELMDSSKDDNYKSAIEYAESKLEKYL